MRARGMSNVYIDSSRFLQVNFTRFGAESSGGAVQVNLGGSSSHFGFNSGYNSSAVLVFEGNATIKNSEFTNNGNDLLNTSSQVSPAALRTINSNFLILDGSSFDENNNIGALIVDGTAIITNTTFRYVKVASEYE